MSGEAQRWRFWLLAACGLGAVLWFFGTFSCSPLLPWCSTVGFSINDVAPRGQPFTVAVTSVEPGGPAYLAGMRSGDRIDLRTAGFVDRWHLRDVYFGNTIGGSSALHYVVQRPGQAKALVIVPRSSVEFSRNSNEWFVSIAWIWSLLFAAFLAYRRPDSHEARILSAVLITGVSQGGLPATPFPSAALCFVYTVLVYTVSFSAPFALFALFASLFARPLAPWRRLLTGATVLCAVVAAVAWVSWYFSVATLFPASPASNHWIRYCGVVANGAGLFAAVICGIAASTSESGSERSRAALVTTAVGFAWIPQAFAGVVVPFVTWQHQPLLVGAVFAVARVAQITMPIGFTYAVLSRRLFDVGFVINRAVVFTGVSVVVIGIFVLVERLLTDWLQGASHTTNLLAAAGLALLLGVSLRAVHARVDQIMDNVFFRRRHEDEQAIRLFAEEAPYITDKPTLLERADAVLQRHTDATFVEIALDGGNGRYGSVDENDPAIVRLRATHRVLDLHAVESQMAGDLAFPMVSCGKLIGVIVLGTRRSGEAYAPDESAAIAQMALSAGAAVDMLEARQGDSVAGLRQEVAALKEAIASMTRVVATELSKSRIL
jgi:GAF domain-containing protein